MKKFILLSAAMMFGIMLSAQTQQGYVKTKGRMVDGKLVPGQGLKGATVSIKGRTTVLVNADNGAFSFPVAETQFRLDSVNKKGYQLVDMDACPKTYKYSSNPLYIVMETPEQQLQDKLNAERKIRRNLQKQLLAKEDEIEALKEKNQISLEEYQKSMQKLYEEQEDNEQLISDMAKRYSELDYDQLDEFYRQVSYCIEGGELTKADSLLRSRGDIKAQVNTIMQRGQTLQEEKEKLQQAETVQQADIEEAAKRCYGFYETFFMQHLNDSAAYYLELRASLDTTNLRWQGNAGKFIDDYLADYDKALSYYQRMMNYANAHPEGNLEYLISSLDNIGYLLSNLSDHANSIQYYNQALDLAMSNFGEMHFLTANIYNNLCFYYIATGEYAKALEYTKKATKIYEAVLDPDDPTIATSYNNIGHAYSEIGNIDSALMYYNKSVSMEERILGIEHPDVALTYNNIGFCYTYRREIQTAMQYFEKALEIDLKVLGPKHPQNAYIYNNIGFLYAAAGNYEKGLENYSKALEIRKNLFGDEHEDTAVSYDNLGNLYSKMGQYDLALENNNKALAIKKKTLGPDHADVGISVYNIGFVYAKQGDYVTAMKYYNDALEILKKSLGEDHYNTKFVLKGINELQEKIKEQDNE